MARPRKRACFEAGDRLDINAMRRRGFDPAERKSIVIDGQKIRITSEPRHFGGYQYYWLVAYTDLPEIVRTVQPCAQRVPSGRGESQRQKPIKQDARRFDARARAGHATSPRSP